MKHLLLPFLLLPVFFCPAAGREIHAGKQYIKINIGEVYIAMRAAGPQSVLRQRLVIRGLLHREPHLERSGTFALIRTAIVCCVLDANLLGLQVRHTMASRGIKSGSWINVYGTLVRTPGPPILQLDKSKFDVAGNHPVFAGVRTDYLFVPDRVEVIRTPAVPFITSWKNGEPYSY